MADAPLVVIPAKAGTPICARRRELRVVREGGNDRNQADLPLANGYLLIPNCYPPPAFHFAPQPLTHLVPSRFQHLTGVGGLPASPCPAKGPVSKARERFEFAWH